MKLTIPLVGHDKAIFEPCHSNPQARILWSEVVELYHMANENHSIFTVQYINAEQKGIEVEIDKTIGAVQP